MSYSKSLCASRSQVLIVGHPDQYLEVFAEKNVDIRVVRTPITSTESAAISAEDFVEQTLPRTWRHLFVPGKLRKSAMLRPLSIDTLVEAAWTKDLIHELNELIQRVSNDSEDLRIWTL